VTADQAGAQTPDHTPAYRAGQAERRFALALTTLRALSLIDHPLASDLAGRWADTLDALPDPPPGDRPRSG